MRALATPNQLELLPERVMNEKVSVPSRLPPPAYQYQIRLERANSLTEQVSILAEWAMKTGFCNNISENSPKAWDKLSLIRRGVTI